MTTISVFGGTGFLGGRLVRRLAAAGGGQCASRSGIPTGRAAPCARLAWTGSRSSALTCADLASVAPAVAGADAVVNAVSAYVEKDGVTFEAVHERGAETLAREAAASGATRLVLVSGIGADPRSGSPYIRARGRGELAVQQAFPGATIVRPNAVFGLGDALFGTLAHLARLLPVLPLIGGGRTRLQPVYVKDVAEAIARMLEDAEAAGRIYEIGGPRVYTLRELVELALHLTGRRRLLLPVPFAVPRS